MFETIVCANSGEISARLQGIGMGVHGSYRLIVL